MMMCSSNLPVHIQALFRPETYAHPVEPIAMIQTHISWVFLTGCYAYKVKKPLRLNFLDFSSLDKRKFYCEQELNLNRRMSADMYLDVLPLCQEGDGFVLGGDGRVCDYVLKMRQFNQADLLDQRLERDQFKPEWMDHLAQTVANFHADQEGSTGCFQGHESLAHQVRMNLDVVEAYMTDVGDGQAWLLAWLSRLGDFVHDVFPLRRAALLARQQDGFVRSCHGDLHLKNMALMYGVPCVFDCIEFNEDFRMIDSMNDVAFLVMDCDAHKRADMGFRFLSRYLEYNGDYSGLELFDLYLFYRATVRAKVAILLAKERDDRDLNDVCKRRQDVQEAQHYLELALTYTHASAVQLFVIGGLSGSGKSHLALLGCGVERAIVIRSDATRKRISGDFPGLDMYGREMHIHTYAAMFADARTALRAGYSVILDATFLHPDSRQQAYDLAKGCDVALSFFWLDIDKELLVARVKQRQAAGKDISDADLSVLDRQCSEYRRPDECWVRFITSSAVWIGCGLSA